MTENSKQEKKRIEIKEALARLMATENITVEHTNIPSAAFDVVNRKLYLPLWKDISEDVYTLLISHEVGHALYTPGEEWKKKVMEGKDTNYKNVVNIIEDVRIEKLIKQKYPGTVRSFRSGYSELEKKNLFGTRSEDKKIEEYGILDRINMFYKVGSFGFADVTFKDDEKHWLSKIDACKTFEDVLKLSKLLLEYAESQPEYQPQNTMESDVVIQAGSEAEAEALKRMFEQSQDQSDNSQSSQSITIEYPKSGSDSDSNENSQDKDSNHDTQQQSKSSDSQQTAKVSSITQDTFDNKMQQYVDVTTEVDTINIPKFDMKKIIVDYQKVLKQLSSYYSGNQAQMNKAKDCLSNFKSNNKHVVSQLVSLFEMKKRAKTDARTKISKTGILDTNKVHAYKYNEDIFRKVANIPVGKSHGLVVFMDMSGSMSTNMTGTYAQMINLAMFCRKINIPFEVYGFSDVTFSKTDSYTPSKNIGDIKPKNVFIPGNFSLRNYLSSRMSLSEFNEMLEYLMCIMSHYSNERLHNQYYLSSGIPYCERLGGTPLNETIVSAMQLVPEFKNNYNLDIVNTVIITDGDGTSGLSYYLSIDSNPYSNQNYYDQYRQSNSLPEKCLNYHSGHIYCRYQDSKKIWHLTDLDKDRRNAYLSYRDISSNLIEMFRDVTNSKMIGFYICNKNHAMNILANPYYSNCTKEECDKLKSDFENKHFAEIKKQGYDSYYIIPASKDLLTSGEEIEFGDTTAKSVIHRRFLKAMSKKKNSRILLGRFIDHIS